MIGCYCVVIRRAKNGLWKCSAFYPDKRGQTLVSVSWHRLRYQAAQEAYGFAHAD
jgi:hypothetical protein